MIPEPHRTFLDQLQARPPPILAVDSSSSSSSSAASTLPPSPLPNPPVNPPCPSSSAATVSPPPSPPATPPPAAPTASLLADRHSAPSPSPSVASSATTVPPPSPAALARLHRGAPARALVVSIDADGIDGWEAQQRTPISPLSYPKLRAPTFGPDDPNSTELILSNRGVEPPYGVLPPSICRFLTPFQRDGVTFMYRLYERGRGGLLADAMGLGKTVQTICFLGAAFAIWDQKLERHRSPRVLVVAPTSVRENWMREFQTWTPFRTMLYDRAVEPELGRKLRDGNVDVVITGNIPVAQYGSEFFSNPVRSAVKWQWDIVIVDEIHVAKNINTKIYKSLAALPKKIMFGLTGTAVQNRLKELWNVMSLVVPETLWPAYKSFKADFIDIVNKGTKRDASAYMRRKAQERIGRLRKLLAKHLVRRPKSVIEAQLPGKTDYCVLMRMKREGLQGYMYQRFQNSYDVKMLRDAKLPCDCGSSVLSKECCHRFPSIDKHREEAPIWMMAHEDARPCERCPNCISLYLQHYSRCLAAHALMLLPADDDHDQDKYLARKQVFQYYLGEQAEKAKRPIALLEREADISCKLNVALKLLKTFESTGHKTIIFYESLRLGDILQRWATNNRLVYEVIDGSVAKGLRQGVVDRFNKNPYCSIFFISKKAGATGLNICGADRVLIFEPCWNPTLDLQAGDRAHRLGQKRVVHIIRLVVENTIEHYVFKTALSKSQVSNAILDNTREQWRVRETEIGSMHAMLSMGDVFETDDHIADDFEVIEAARLNERKRKGQESSNNDSPPDPSEEEHDSIQEDICPDVDILGEDVMCSLDVDVNAGDIDVAVSDDESEEAQDAGFIPSESQFDTDVLLGAGGARKKLVMQSTSARKRQRQMMGTSSCRRSSGINPDGAAKVNFDDAEYDAVMESKTKEEEGEDSDEEPAVRRSSRRRYARPTTAVVENSQQQAGRGKRTEASARSKDQGANLPAKKSNKTKAAPLSAFAARARVRRGG